jgi:serine/threonine protein kinase
MDVLAAPEVPGFIVERGLGRGGSSSVWLVREERTGRNFALKCLRTSPVQDNRPSDGSGEEALRREIRILSVLDHPHLIKAHAAVHVAAATGGKDGSGVSGDGLGLLVEYASGGSLGQLVSSRGRLSVGETVTVLTPIAQVLGYLHGKGFTHSDVSPGNVLFTGHGKPMLADVGISRMVGDAAAVPDHGTAGFLDPTPVDAVRAGLQPERDVYAVAALGWYCLTGEPPRRTADRPPLSLLLPEIPADLAAALESGLNEDRRLRPTAVELATAVYRSADPLPVDLAGSVHPTVIPELLTRRRLPERSRGALSESIAAWRRRVSTSRWSGVLCARQMMPFPLAEKPEAAESMEGTAVPRTHGKHAVPPSRVSGPGHGGGRGRGRGIIGTAAGAAAVMAGIIWAAGAPGTDSARGNGSPEQAPFSDAQVTPDPVASNAGIPESVSAQLASADPAEAVQGLAWIRSQAFGSGRVELLDHVNAPGSPAAAADGRIKARLQESGHVLAGFTSTLSRVETRPESSSGRAVVGITLATSSYEEQDRSGAVAASGPPGERQELVLVLVPVDGRWRITEILPGT